MKLTEQQLQDMIQKSQFGKPEGEPEFWFSYPAQKKLAFQIARELVLDGEDADEAIEKAKSFIDKFYLKAIKAGSWER